MSWIAVSPALEQQSPPSVRNTRIEASKVLRASRDVWMECGSLMIEARLGPVSSPERVIDIPFDYPTRGRFSINRIPGGSLALVLTCGDEVRHAALSLRHSDHGDLVRLTYRWDVASGQASLWAEMPGQLSMPMRAKLDSPLALPRTALVLAAKKLTKGQVAPEVEVMALSDAIEPVGPMPSLLGRTHILTPDGPRRADALQRGDLVMVPGRGATPIIASISRIVPARGDFAPVLIEAPRFGLQEDVLVAAGQRIVISGSDVEYLFGSEKVLVPARHLIGDGIAHYARPRRTITYVQFLLPGQQSLIAGGAVMESLHVSRLRRRADLQAASLLNDVARAELPDHAVTAHPVLNGFEAVTLASYRAA